MSAVDETKSFRMRATTHTKVAAVATAESRSMTAQLDLIVDEWMAANGYTVSRSGKVKRPEAAPA